MSPSCIGCCAPADGPTHLFLAFLHLPPRYMDAGLCKPAFTFSANAGPAGYWAIDPKNPEGALAYEEDGIRELLARHGLMIEAPIRYGNWSGRPDGLSLQDIVVARRNEA